LLLSQLDELSLAEGSPIGRADEQQSQALRSAQRLEGLALAVLIDSLERGDFRTYGRAGFQILIQAGNRVQPGFFVGGPSGGAQRAQYKEARRSEACHDFIVYLLAVSFQRSAVSFQHSASAVWLTADR
jgi:hypothetical protein